jgi:predicted metal-dependent phosphoesterase TrpH
MPGQRAFLDLHCHTSASFDSLASPSAVVSAAHRRGITHLAITDHDRIDGALRARDLAPEGLTILVGEEIRTRDGDLIAVFLEEPIEPGMSATETIEAIRAQRGLVGIPHPFDRFRGSISKGEHPAGIEALAATVDWIEAWNARVMWGDGNLHAAELAREVGVPGVSVSDAHTTIEVGIAATAVQGDPSTPEGLRAALAGPLELTPAHASVYVRLFMPAAKLVQRVRGRGRVRRTPPSHPASSALR